MPLPLTVSCFSKIQIGFTFLVPAHPDSPGKRAVKRVCVDARRNAKYRTYEDEIVTVRSQLTCIWLLWMLVCSADRLRRKWVDRRSNTAACVGRLTTYRPKTDCQSSRLGLWQIEGQQIYDRKRTRVKEAPAVKCYGACKVNRTPRTRTATQVAT